MNHLPLPSAASHSLTLSSKEVNPDTYWESPSEEFLCQRLLCFQYFPQWFETLQKPTAHLSTLTTLDLFRFRAGTWNLTDFQESVDSGDGTTSHPTEEEPPNFVKWQKSFWNLDFAPFMENETKTEYPGGLGNKECPVISMQQKEWRGETHLGSRPV